MISVTQIGCGGTGSWVVPLVSKLLNNLSLHLNTEETQIRYELVDCDIVERRNILRQNFTEWDIGKSKVQALVSRYVYNFPDYLFGNKTKIKSVKNVISLTFGNYNLRFLQIFLGCVDNNLTRRHIYKACSKLHKTEDKDVFIYIDSGNNVYNGQIVTSVFGLKENDKSCLTNFKPYKQLNFLKMFSDKVEQESGEQSCAFFGDQSQAINNLAAALMFCCLQRILVASELPPQIIYFNSSGYANFEI